MQRAKFKMLVAFGIYYKVEKSRRDTDILLFES
jgi:hypothetical protein